MMGKRNQSLRIKLVGTRSNRDGIGTMAIVKANGDRQTQLLRSGSGYLSSSDLVLTFGLGKSGKPMRSNCAGPAVRWTN